VIIWVPSDLMIAPASTVTPSSTSGSPTGRTVTVLNMSTISTVAPSASSFPDVAVSLIRNGAPAAIPTTTSPAA
jgi:hypothetical protein